jgi:hypothetical protein
MIISTKYGCDPSQDLKGWQIPEKRPLSSEACTIYTSLQSAATLQDDHKIMRAKFNRTLGKLTTGYGDNMLAQYR